MRSPPQNPVLFPHVRIEVVGDALVPARKSDLVRGTYDIEAPAGSMIAVRITDMLGEEVLVVPAN